jgi:hypothetical protein
MRFWIVVVLLMAGCTSSGDPATVALPGDFLPLKTGLWFIYAVDSVVTDQNIATTYSYELKIEVTDSFPNAAGAYSYLLRRSKRVGNATTWTPLTSWSARSNRYEVVVTEGNIPFVKINTPVQNDNYWNGNELNALPGTEKCPGSANQDCDLYTLTAVNSPYANEWFSFDKSLTVVQNDDPGVIVSQDIRSEIYVYNVGLASKKIDLINYCSSQSCAGQQFVDHGLQYQQILKEYGGH